MRRHNGGQVQLFCAEYVAGIRWLRQKPQFAANGNDYASDRTLNLSALDNVYIIVKMKLSTNSSSQSF
jgi:hypothetical protein